MGNQSLQSPVGCAGAIGNPIPFQGTNILQLIRSNDSQKPTIEINTVHLSCESDIHDPRKNQVGLIVYSYKGQTDFYLNGKHCQTGYILIKNTENIEHVASNQGQVHGKLFKWFFGEEPNKNFIGAGFAYVNGKWKFHSFTYNANSADGYHDDDNDMHEYEKELLRKMIYNFYVNNKWQSCQTIQIRDLAQL